MIADERKKGYNVRMNIEIDKIKNIAIYLSQKIDKLYYTKFLKLLYYLDFISVQETGKPITNDTYFHLTYGPIPSFIKDNIDLLDASAKKIKSDLLKGPDGESFSEESIFENSIELKSVEGSNGNILKPVDGVSFDQNQISSYEKTLLDDLIEQFKDLSTKSIVDKTHNEPPYLQTTPNNRIDYEMAFQLNIKDILPKRSFSFDKEFSLSRFKTS